MSNESLTNDQQQVVELFRSGKNIFLTGKAGTGKYYTVRAIINRSESQLTVTAPTGKAAQNIGGTTIHSFAGIGLGSGSRYQLLDRVMMNKDSKKRWEQCSCLIVDEVSLLSRNMFEALEFIARSVRQTNLVFGGIQLLFSGDFFQIPSISDDGVPLDFCFCSPLWDSCFSSFQIELTEILRQKETEFFSMLSELRSGVLGPLSLNLFTRLARPLDWGNQLPVKLFPRKEDAYEENMRMLAAISGEVVVFKAFDGGAKKDLLDKHCPLLRALSLKVGAPVMLIINAHEHNLVNGSIGKVKGFIDGYPQVEFESGRVVTVKEYVWCLGDGEGRITATRKQIPLLLGWAYTIHKSQGLTLEKAEVSLRGLFVFGQAYTGVGRVPLLSGLRIIPGFDTQLPPIDPRVVEFYNRNVHPAFAIHAISSSKTAMPPQCVENGNLSNDMLQDQTCEINWSDIEPIPSHIDMASTTKDLMNDPITSSKCASLMGLMGFGFSQLPEATAQLIAFIWSKLNQIIIITKKKDQTSKVIDKKCWVGHARELHRFKLSSNLLQHWRDTLERCNVPTSPVLKVTETQRTVMVMLVDRLHKTFIDNMSKEKATGAGAVQLSPQHPTVTPVFTKECQAKIRYLAGWTVMKEIKSCSKYIAKNASSKNGKVLRRVKKEEEFKASLMSFTTTQSLEDSTKYSSSLKHLRVHNRGGLTYVTDEYYEFQLAVETSCIEHFTDNNLTTHKFDACKVARNEVRNDPLVRDSWVNLCRTHLVDKSTCKDLDSVNQKHTEKQSNPKRANASSEVQDPTKDGMNTLFNRLMKRYLNMRTNEYVRKLKRELNKEKKKEHRKNVQKKSEKANKSKNKGLVHEMLQDDLPLKISSHFKLKSVTCRGVYELGNLTKPELHFISHLYGKKFRPSATKNETSKTLSDTILQAPHMCRPDLLKQSELDKIKSLKDRCNHCWNIQDTCTISAHTNTVPHVQSNTTQPAKPQNVQPVARKPQRRKQFRPTQQQLAILQADHDNGNYKNVDLLKQRASEFSVNVCQVKSWHVRYKHKIKRN